MLRTKKDVEKHVTCALSKIDNENERKLRGYTCARLYFQVKDYESAKRYLSTFLSVRDHHAPSHKLMAEIYEATGNIETALQCYKRSLEIDPQQKEIVLKICEMYCQLPVDHETACYWADRAEQIFPHHETVFRLRECLVSAEGEPDRGELEKLIATELAAQPKNVDLRIKLLRLYLDTERVKEAYDHAIKIESKSLFPNSTDWYYLLGDIFEAYQEEFNKDLDNRFYINFLTSLDHLMSLTVAEPHTLTYENGKKLSSINDAAAVLLSFDQQLKKAVERDVREGSWVYFLHHMKGQLYFQMASLLMKRAKKDQGNWKEACRFSSALFLIGYTFKPVNLLQEIWFSKMEDNQKLFSNFFQQGALRTSYTGHVIMNLCSEDKSKWLQKIKHDVCLPQVRERIYQRLFGSIIQKEKLSSSYFIQDPTFVQCSLEFPSNKALLEYNLSTYKLCCDSLHHLVWLQLHQDIQGSKDTSDSSLSEVFKGLQYSNKNLSNGSAESLCILDFEAYLQATTYQAKHMVERKVSMYNERSQHSTLCFPPDITDPLCSKQQANWWYGAYGLFSCSISEKFGEHRRNLQHGLEVIRGVGNHGLEVQLVVHLAHYFADKSNNISKKDLDTTESKTASTDFTALETRATHYWNIAIGLLDKLSAGQTLRVPRDQMFVGGEQKLGQDEIKSLKEEGKLYLAVTLMNSEKLDEAAEILGKLVSPFASYYLSLILKKTAFNEEKSSNARTVLLNKAKNALHETMDRIKDNNDHPLNKEIYLELEEVECELAKDHNSSYYEDNGEVCDETDAYDDLNITPVHNTSFGRNGTPSRLFPKSTSHSTPRPSSSFMSKSKHQYLSKERSQHIQPSPERLDAQIRALALNQDTLVKTLLQQQQALLDTSKAIVEGLKQNKDVVEQVTKQLEEIQLSNFKFFTRRTKKASLMKGQGDDEDDYEYDANGLLEYYGEENGDDFRTSGAYAFDAPRMVHDAAAPPPMNYVVSPAMQPGPPPLGHFNYPYSAMAPAPPAVPVATAERSYYHPTASQGLPFSEGQQLPQFQFHVASPIGKPPPPGSVMSLPPQQALPPPSGIPPSAVIPQAQVPGIAASPWLKPVGVPHAFQIPLPAVGMVAPPPTTATILPPQVPLPQQVAPPSELKSMLSPQVTEGSLSFGPACVKSPVAMQLPSPSMFAGLNTSPQYKNRSRCDSDVIGSDVEAHDLEREVMGDFKPLIPLPAEVVVETGEENEEVLFEDRAKLYRFVDQEWKERGIGVVKMLHHESSGRVRLLMRRDQVLKVCANHYITSKMEINAMKSSDRAWTWVAQDFADEELKPESFCIRFKTTDIAVAFKNAFEKSLAIAKQAEQIFASTPKSASGKSPKVSTTQESSFGIKFAPKAGSWTCPTCYVSNTAERSLCVACETQKPGLHSAVTSPSSEIRPVVSSVTSKPFVFQSQIGSSAGSQGPFAANKLDQQATGQKPFSIFSKSNPLTPVTGAAKNTLGGFTFTSSPTIQEMKDVEADREILVVSTKSKNGPQVTKLSTPKASPFSGFSFKSPPSTLPTSWSVGSSTMTTVDSTSGVSKVNSSSVYSFKSPTSAQVPSAVTFYSDSTSTDEDSTSTTVDSSSASQEVPKTKDPEKIFGSNSAVKVVDFATLSGDHGFGKGTKELSSALCSASPLIVTISKDGRRVSSDGVGENGPEEFIPTVDFKPVVPLPALVDVKTGEENEEKLFGERAKLFRYDSELKEWKERGIGELKILRQSENQKYRILMRRDQVLKLCANHYILPDMKLTPLNNNEKSYSWFAQDFSEGDLRQEQFAVRFKTGDLAKQFFDVFTKCQSILRTSSKKSDSVCDNTIPKDPCIGNTAKFSQVFRPVSEAFQSASASSDQKPLSTLFRPEPDSWECNGCYVRNKSSDVKCVSCGFVKAGIKATSNEKPVYGGKPVDYKQQCFGNIFTPQSGPWECNCCYVMNKSSDMKCVACGFIKSDNQVTPSDKTVFGSKPVLDERQQSFDNLFKPQPGTWECQSCLVRNSADKTNCVSCQTTKSGSSITKPATSSAVFGKFQFGTSSATTPITKPNESSNQGIFGKFSFGASPTAASPFSFKTPKPGEFVFGMPAKSQPSTFSFGMTSVKSSPDEKTGFKPNLGDNASTAPAIFGGAMQNSISPSKTSAAIPIATTTTSATTGFNFETAASEAPTKFCFGSPQKYEFSFSGVRARSPSKTPKSPRSPAAPSDVEDDDDVESSDVDNIYFQPVIPLPPKVETKTGEEDEKVLFCKRAKLFRFIDREWKERGIGEIKILLDESQRKVRLLMRRDQVLKVCLNHCLTREIVFDWRGEKSITWATTDFSETEPSPELFAVRFKTQEIAAEFKAAIDEANDVAEGKAATPKGQKAPSSVNNAAKPFSFKMDSDKNVMTASSSFSLATRFGTSAVVTKSLFGNTSPSQSDAQPLSFGAKTPFSFAAKESLPTGVGFFDTKPTDSDSPDSTSSEQSFKFDTDSKLSSKKDDQRANEDIEVVYQASPDLCDAAEAKRLLLPPTFFLYKLKEPCKGCIGCTDYIPPYRGDIAESQEIKVPTSYTPPSDVQSVFPNATASTCSFADLVADKPGFASQTPKQSSPSSSKAVFAGAGTPLFGNLNNSTEGAGEDDDSVAQCPDIHFEPVIPLPQLIVVKTGEEDETSVFVNRAKLYRFDTPLKQWKERGVGELKILQHKHKLSFRIILRRDQVHKIACNHCITADMELNPMNTSESSLCWYAMDYSEGDGVASQFAVKFKTKELLSEFKAKFEECKTKLSESKETGETRIQQITTGVSEIETAENFNQQIAFDDGTTDFAPNSNSILQSSGIEGQQVEEEDLEDEEDEIMFEKRVSLAIYDDTTKSFQKAGMGYLRIFYDDEVFGYRITMTGDNETILCDHIIAIQTSLRVDKKIAVWSAIDLSIEPPRTRQFQATFSSADAIAEFSKLFEEGKEAAVHSEIVEKSDCRLPSNYSQS